MSRERSSDRRSPVENDALETYWKAVKHDPGDFEAWTQLLQQVEALDDSHEARSAYDAFLSRFPYCYGYWRKYAEFERRHQHEQRANAVYERGLTSIPLSIDLWLSYIAFYKEYTVSFEQSSAEREDRKVRAVYEKAIEAAGLEFKSDKLWEDYVGWELEHRYLKRVLAIYDRLLRVPTSLYSAHFERIQELVNTRLPDEILQESEYYTLRKQVEEELEDTELYTVEEVVLKNDSGSEVVDSKVKFIKRFSDKALEKFRLLILEPRRKEHLATEAEVSKRWTFEEGIKRSYFHVKPLERAQLKNWRSYLDFEIAQGDRRRIGVLFERCLIACSMYEDIWIKYARYMEENDENAAREIFQRVCYTHLPKKPNPRLAWSAFEENLGKVNEARRILKEFSIAMPGLASVETRRINIERRKLEAVLTQSSTSSSADVDYSSVSKYYESLIRDRDLSPAVTSFYAIKYARFVAKVKGDRRFAEKILLNAINSDRSNVQLYLQVIDLAYNSHVPVRVSAVVEAMDRALSAPIDSREKLLFSQRKLEFLEEFSPSIKDVQEHYEWHLKLTRSLAPQARKRPTDSMNGPPNKAPALAPHPQPMPQHGLPGVPLQMGAPMPAPPVMPAGPPIAAFAAQPFPHQWNQFGAYYYPPPY